jgi:hypothetical protein
MFGIDPLLGTILTAGGIFVVSYLINRQHFQAQYESVIEATIDHLIKDGYVATRKDKDGDIELIPIKELHNVDF